MGDELTAGVPPGAPLGSATVPSRSFPARLAGLLGPDVTVVNRGLPGATVRDWLGILGLDPGAMRLVAQRAWPDLGTPPLAEEGASLLTYVLGLDRPDVALIVLGSNDLQPRLPGGPVPSPAAIADRLIEVTARVRALVPRVLMGTVPPGPRVSAESAAILNQRLCQAVPDCVRLDVALAATGRSLLDDDLAPTPSTTAAFARAFAKALRPHRAPASLGLGARDVLGGVPQP